VTVGDVRRILDAIPEGDSKLQGLISGLIAHGFTPAEAEKIARKYLGVVPSRRNPDDIVKPYGDAIREALNAGKYQKAVIGLANLTAVLAHKHASLSEQEQHRFILNDVLRALEDVEVHLEMNPPRTVLFHRIPRLPPRSNPNPEG
jgi:hypothetical protein